MAYLRKFRFVSKKSMILALGLKNLSQNYSPQVKLSRHVSATSQTFFVSVLYTSLSHPNLNWVLGRRGFVWRTSYASVPKTTTRDKFDPCYSPTKIHRTLVISRRQAINRNGTPGLPMKPNEVILSLTLKTILS